MLIGITSIKKTDDEYTNPSIIFPSVIKTEKRICIFNKILQFILVCSFLGRSKKFLTNTGELRCPEHMTIGKLQSFPFLIKYPKMLYSV